MHPVRVVALALTTLLLISLSFAAGVVTAWTFPPPARAAQLGPLAGLAGDPLRLAPFNEVVNIVRRDFYERGKLDQQELAYGAIRGLLSTLNDPFTFHAPKRHAEMLEEDLKGSFDGIGAYVEMRDGQLTIVSPRAGSPAARAGLRPGDQIVSINGRPTEGLSLADAVALIRGPRGTVVRLTVRRPGVSEPLEFAVERAEIRQELVTWQMLDGQIAYLRLWNFGQVMSQLNEAVSAIAAAKPRGIVLDVRNNGGGYLPTAIDVASLFLPRDSIILWQDSGAGQPQALRSTRDGSLQGIPLVVLVNHGSASASEIVAGALQDHQRATVVGERTFGKGSVQNVYQLSDGSSLRLTIARWLTPNQREINKVGIAPDIEQAGPERLTEIEPNPAADPQLQRALEILAGQRP
jgi:carboxyl-terminal processing protease